MHDPELERYQQAIAAHLSESRDPAGLVDDPALAPWRDYVAAIEPHLYEVAGLLLVIWVARLNATR